MKPDYSLVIFDKDGTLIKPISENDFVQNPQDQQLLPGVISGLKDFRSQGCSLAIASNQSGVELNLKSLNDTILEMQVALELTRIVKGCFCPDLAGKECYLNILGSEESIKVHDSVYGESLIGTFRKPNPGMLNYFCRSLNVNPLNVNPFDVLYIGDRLEDQQAASNAGASFMWADQWRSLYL